VAQGGIVLFVSVVDQVDSNLAGRYLNRLGLLFLIVFSALVFFFLIFSRRFIPCRVPFFLDDLL